MRLDDRLAPREIVRALAAGEVSGVEATQLPVRAVYDITHHERRRRRAAAEREQAKTEKGRARLVLRTMLTEVEERMAADPSTAELYTLSRAMPNLVRGLDTLGIPSRYSMPPSPMGSKPCPRKTASSVAWRSATKPIYTGGPRRKLSNKPTPRNRARPSASRTCWRTRAPKATAA
jgi:hypothetical protein